MWPHSPLAGFNGAEDDALPSVFHGTTKEDKGKELALGGFRFPPPMDIEDVEVSPLHMIFDLKGVLVRKECFRVNYLLPMSFNLDWGPTLLGKSIVPRPTLKEFLLKCLK